MTEALAPLAAERVAPLRRVIARVEARLREAWTKGLSTHEVRAIEKELARLHEHERALIVGDEDVAAGI